LTRLSAGAAPGSSAGLHDTVAVDPSPLDVLGVAPARPAGRRRLPTVSIVIATALLCSIVALVVLAPLLPGYDPVTQHLDASQLRPLSDGHLLGTDPLGRDELSRVALAGRVSILIALAVVALNLVIGVVVGLTAGYFGGRADYLLMGLADLQLTIPVLLLLIAVIAAVGPSTTTLVVVLGVTFWVRYARVTRVIAASLREREFVLAAVTQGATDRWIMVKHLLPTVIPQLIVMGTFDIGTIVIAEASLSYLGLGVQAPTPSWGGMIAEGQRYLQTNPALVLVPAAAVFALLGGLAILGQRFSATYGRGGADLVTGRR
jgi:ABC-type dipeptide/oligopeptide/nickel transport system permease subunit